MFACKLLIKQLIQQYSLFLRIDTASKNMILWYSSVIDIYPLFTGLQPVSHKKGSNIQKEEWFSRQNQHILSTFMTSKISQVPLYQKATGA